MITPDRFVNGNPENDAVVGMKEQPNRTDKDGRHGGDIQGMINSLDYLQKMGFTAIWSTPVLENDMKNSSYHGYAITDLYKPDPRFGTMDEYIELATKGNEKGIKMVMDQVANHIGIEHWWMHDLPSKEWINYQVSHFSGEDPKLALIFVISSIIVLFFLKNFFNYLAMFFITFLRNGVLKDVRNDLYEKTVALPLAYFSEKSDGIKNHTHIYTPYIILFQNKSIL